MKWSRFWILALMISGLAACGGGGGGGTTSSGSQDYAIFTSQTSGVTSLKSYDPVTNAISTIPTTKLLYKAGIHDGTTNPTTLVTSNLHLSDVIYWDNGSFYTVSTAQSDKLAVTQRSSYAGTVCDQSLFNNYLVVIDAGSNNTCNDSDDLVYAITDKMSSTDAPILLPARPSVVLFSDYSTAIGMLYVNGSSSLVFADANGQNPVTLLGGVSSVSEMDNFGNFANDILLDIDGKVEMFDETAKTLSGALYTTSYSLGKTISDGTNYYYFDNQDLYAIPVAGGSAKLVTTVAAATDINIDFVQNQYLVYHTYDSSSGLGIWKLNSINLNNAAGVKVLVTTYSPVSVSLAGFGGNYTYYEVSTTGSTDHSGDIAGAIKTDGTGRQEITGASWVGYAIAETISSGKNITMSNIILDKYVLDGSGNISGGHISIYEPATDTVSSDQGNLPAGIVRFSSMGFGSDIYGEFYDSNGSAYLAHLNTTRANSMKRLDLSTAAVTDSPIL